MCCNTKQKIADAMRRQIMEKSFEKITVQNLMDATNMKRQSFYYHFQDTRDVLMWICEQELAQPLKRSNLQLSDWLCYALQLLDNNRCFYRRVLDAANPEFVQEFGLQVIGPRISLQLYATQNWRQLDADRQFVVGFISQAITNWLVQLIRNRRYPEPSDARRKLRCLLDTLRLSGVTMLKGLISLKSSDSYFPSADLEMPVSSASCSKVRCRSTRRSFSFSCMVSFVFIKVISKTVFFHYITAVYNRGNIKFCGSFPSFWISGKGPFFVVEYGQIRLHLRLRVKLDN